MKNTWSLVQSSENLFFKCYWKCLMHSNFYRLLGQPGTAEVVFNSIFGIKEEAEQCVKLIGRCCERNKLKMGVTKTQTILIRKRQTTYLIILSIGGIKLCPSEVITYLAINVRRKFNMTSHNI